MSRCALSLIGLLVLAINLPAQFYNWGWGPEISVNQVGSNITCTVWDPYLNTSRTQSYSSVASWTNDDGVVATVSGNGIVRAIVYDLDLGSFQEDQLTSTSGSTVINSDGVVAWVSGPGIVGAAIYDPGAHTWRDEQFSSNSGNQIQNRDGVVSWVSSSGILGAAVYDPGLAQWQDEQFSSNSGNVVQNRDGIVAWVSSSGILGAAIYDPAMNQWVDEQFSSNNGNALVIGQGVVAWKSASGILGGAAYNWTDHAWDDSQFGSSSSNTMPTIVDGTVFWNNSNGQQRYGYTSNGQWQNNANTAVRCVYFAEVVGAGGSPNIAYLWCLSIGASSYTHQCGDGHQITRRWAWKAYQNPGSYTPQLSVFSSTTNSQCSGNVAFVGTGITEPIRGKLTVLVQSGALQVTGDAVLGMLTIVDPKGATVHAGAYPGTTASIALPAATGVYALRTAAGPVLRFVVER